MARRLDPGKFDDGSDFSFEGDGTPAPVDSGIVAPPIDTPIDMGTLPPPDVWNPGGDGGVPPTAQPTDPQTIAPKLFSPEVLPVAGDATGGGTTGLQIPTNPNGSQVGAGTPWATGASQPSSAPPGYHWDANYAMFMPNATSTTPTTGGGIPTTGRTSDDASILAQIAQWAGMSGADPSLANDPNYWLGRIKATGGLGQDNLQYWQDAGVGAGAFFRNPFRETGGVAPTTATSKTGTTFSNPGSSPTSGNFASLLAQLQGMFGPNSSPSSLSAPNGAGLPLSPGLNQIGQTPLDKQMDASLSDLLTHGGASPYGRTIEATLNDLISRGGVTPNMTAQLTQARDTEAGAMAGQTADARAALAARGLASPHGSGEGPETTAIGRISQGLAPAYASAVTDINTHAIDVANSSVLSALSMATGLSQQDASTILNTVGTGTTRQTALANIALKTLEDNMQWNEFLANFGLQKDQVAEQLAQGRISALTPLLNLFLLMSGQSAQGFIGQ